MLIIFPDAIDQAELHKFFILATDTHRLTQTKNISEIFYISLNKSFSRPTMAGEKPCAPWAVKTSRSDAVLVRTMPAAASFSAKLQRRRKPWRKRAYPGIALAKMGRPSEKYLLGNAPGISQLVCVRWCGSVAK